MFINGEPTDLNKKFKLYCEMFDTLQNGRIDLVEFKQALTTADKSLRKLSK